MIFISSALHPRFCMIVWNIVEHGIVHQHLFVIATRRWTWRKTSTLGTEYSPVFFNTGWQAFHADLVKTAEESSCFIDSISAEYTGWPHHTVAQSKLINRISNCLLRVYTGKTKYSGYELDQGVHVAENKLTTDYD